MIEDLRDGFVPGSFTPLRALLVLAAVATLALLTARLLGRRASALAAGVGLVLLLVAMLRPLADAANLLRQDEPAAGHAALAALLLLGLGAGALASRGEPSHVPVVALVLTQLPVHASFPTVRFVNFAFVGESPPEVLADGRGALVALLFGGALAALRPTPRAAAAAVAAVVLISAASPLFASAPVHAVAAGVGLAVLLPALARLTPPRPSSAGVVLGVVLVLGAAVADDALADRLFPEARPELGLEVLSNEEYERLSRMLDPSRILPSLERPPPSAFPR